MFVNHYFVIRMKAANMSHFNNGAGAVTEVADLRGWNIQTNTAVQTVGVM